MKALKLWKKAAALDLSRELAYKANFILKCFAFGITDFIGPFLSLLIYSTTMGIPGWSFYEFLLFQGTLIIFFGLGHIFVMALPYDTIYAIDKGEFDKYLVKPFSPLLYLMSQSILVEGFVEFFAGVAIAGYAIFKLGIPLFSVNILLYLLLIFLGLVFQTAVMILVSAFAFFVVKSEALMNLYFKLTDFARWPVTIYSPVLKMFLIFFFPVSISAFFPSEVLLRGFDLAIMLEATIPVIIFLVIVIFVWNMAMKRYASAGG